MKNIAIFISGSGSNLQAIIDNMSNINGTIKFVLSNKEDAYGLKRAQLANIDTYVIKKNDIEILKLLKENDIDLIVLAGYLAIVSDTLIKEYPNKIINIHPSLIPSFCGHKAYGLKVSEMAYERGVKVTGVTIHFVDEVVDGGYIIAQKAVDIQECKSPLEIQQKVLNYEHELLVFVVKKYCKNKVIIENERVNII